MDMKTSKQENRLMAATLFVFLSAVHPLCCWEI